MDKECISSFNSLQKFLKTHFWNSLESRDCCGYPGCKTSAHQSYKLHNCVGDTLAWLRLLEVWVPLPPPSELNTNSIALLEMKTGILVTQPKVWMASTLPNIFVGWWSEMSDGKLGDAFPSKASGLICWQFGEFHWQLEFSSRSLVWIGCCQLSGLLYSPDTIFNLVCTLRTNAF